MKLQVNSRETILLKDTADTFGSFEEININCGTMIASQEIYGILGGIPGSLNCGDTHIIPRPENPLL